MRVTVNGVRLYFDVDGAQLVPDGLGMRERPTLLLLHGAGFTLDTTVTVDGQNRTATRVSPTELDVSPLPQVLGVTVPDVTTTVREAFRLLAPAVAAA